MENLSDEVLLGIFDFVGLDKCSNIGILSQVCKQFRRIVNDEKIWKKFFEKRWSTIKHFTLEESTRMNWRTRYRHFVTLEKTGKLKSRFVETPKQRFWKVTKSNCRIGSWDDVKSGSFVIIDDEPWQIVTNYVIWCGCARHCDDMDCTLIQPFTMKTRSHYFVNFNCQQLKEPLIFEKEYEVIDVDDKEETFTVFNDDNESKEIGFPQDGELLSYILEAFQSGKVVRVRVMSILEEEEIVTIISDN